MRGGGPEFFHALKQVNSTAAHSLFTLNLVILHVVFTIRFWFILHSFGKALKVPGESKMSFRDSVVVPLGKLTPIVVRRNFLDL